MKSNTEQRRSMVYLDSFPLTRVLRDQQARLASHKGTLSLQRLRILSLAVK